MELEIKGHCNGKEYTLTPSGWKDRMQVMALPWIQRSLNKQYAAEVEKLKATIPKTKEQIESEKIEEEINKCLEKVDDDICYAKMNLAKVTSKYRKIGKPDKAIMTYEKYFSKYGSEIISYQLCTSIAAAYMDLHDNQNSKKFLHMAYQINSESYYLDNTFLRLDKYK